MIVPSAAARLRAVETATRAQAGKVHLRHRPPTQLLYSHRARANPGQGVDIDRLHGITGRRGRLRPAQPLGRNPLRLGLDSGRHRGKAQAGLATQALINALAQPAPVRLFNGKVGAQV